LLEDFATHLHLPTSTITSTTNFSQQTLTLLHNHFLALSSFVSKIKKVELYQGEDYNDELDFEMQRIAKG